MFDFHIHSTVSFDGESEPIDILRSAEEKGLREICFTDHIDYVPTVPNENFAFDTETYHNAYDALSSGKVVIRRGCELGMLPDNREVLEADSRRRSFDFVIGSVHCLDGYDIYYPDYWQGRTVEQVERRYLEEILVCVEKHDSFDVLGHLTYITKTDAHPHHRPLAYDRYPKLVDEIFSLLIRKGKGIEINTSGKDICGAFLPDVRYLRRFRELGGRIVTVGSDAHSHTKVGKYCDEACRMVQDIFGYVCTFRDREPIFHKR